MKKQAMRSGVEKTQDTLEQKRKTRTKTRSRPLCTFFSALLSFFLVCVTLLSIAVVAGAVYVRCHPALFTVDLSRLAPTGIKEPTTLYYFADGVSDPTVKTESALPLESLSNGERSVFVPLSEIPDRLQNAFIAIEDKRFYRHNGIDLRRTGAAVLNFLLTRDKSFGGSTITQQLVKNLTGEAEKSTARKVREVFRALDLEKRLEKEEILEAYLNIIGLANGCVGVGSASEYYFEKSPDELTLAECASIAAITKHPARYDPIRHPDENEKRRNAILREMRAQGYITEAEYREAVACAVVTAKRTEEEREAEKRSSWYADLVVEDVIRDLEAMHGYTRSEAARLIYHSGLKIYTPIVPALQDTLAAYYRDETNFPLLKGGVRPESAMIVLDPRTGNVLAVAGAIGEKNGDRLLNYAGGAKRPPGSVLKPLSVYAPALEYGIAGYASVYDDVPVRFTKKTDGGYAPWPHNASGIYRGLTSVNDAVKNSLNTVAVRVLSEVGLDRSFAFLRDRLGFTSLVENENGRSDRGLAALALGQMTYGATVREITSAYTALANGGIYRNARSYLLVTDALGRVLLDNTPDVRHALSEGNAELLTKMLENVAKSGTARALTLTRDVAVAGKTGTTQYSLDRWFVGYTPTLLAGVWYGSSTPDALSALDGNPALSTFDTVMKSFYEKNADSFDSAQRHFSYGHLRAVRVCADSGLLTSDPCTLDPRGDRSTIAYFTEDSVPTTFCTCHVLVPYSGTGNRPEDGVVTPGASVSPTRTVGLLRVKRAFPIELLVSDAEYTASPPGVTIFPSSDNRVAYYLPSLERGSFVGKSPTPYPFNRPAKRRTNESESD